MVSSSNAVVVGKVRGVHGVRGWLKIQSFTDPQDNLFQYQPWFITHISQDNPVEFTEFKAHGKGFIAHIKGCDDRDLAVKYMNCEITIDKQQLPTLPDGEYYWMDLVGLKVYTEAQRYIGVVEHCMATGANDVLVVQGEQEHLIPLLMDTVVKKVDLAEKTIIVDWDERF